MNLELKKNIKQIKDHHKGAAVCSVKFCDWARERPKSVAALTENRLPDTSEDEDCWMFISCDTSGKVVINEITSLAFGYCLADDRVLIDPKKHNGPIYQTLSARFFNPNFPQGVENDTKTIVALGSEDFVTVYQVLKGEFLQLY